MIENFNKNNRENDELNFNNDEIDYNNLINKLIEIKTKIVLMEKIISN